ncbi:MAG: ATP-binding protein [Rhizobacter sp.]|nr:ATP-binding protein [Chlorobiales bacterium]
MPTSPISAAETVPAKTSSLRRRLRFIIFFSCLTAAIGLTYIFIYILGRYERASALDKANHAFDYVLIASREQAKERGFTTTVLSNPKDRRTFEKISALRRHGDLYLDSILIIARASFGANLTVQDEHDRLVRLRERRDDYRIKVDSILTKHRPTPEFVEGWITAQTDIIMQENTLSKTLFASNEKVEKVLQFNSLIKNSVFTASEFSGRERALLGFAIGSGLPISDTHLSRLLKYRGVVEENLRQVIGYKHSDDITPAVRTAIEKMETDFLMTYERVRQEVYRSSERSEPYPVSTETWITASTTGINSILDISDLVSQQVDRLIRDEYQNCIQKIIVAIGVGIGVIAFAAMSLWVLGNMTTQLYHLEMAASRVTKGDFSQPVAVFSNDELGHFVRSFNKMVGRNAALLGRYKSKYGEVLQTVGKMRELNTNLVELDREKNEFFGVVTHDLKSPLQAIVGFSNLIERHHGRNKLDQIPDYAKRIEREAMRMSEAISKLLEINMIESGKWTMSPQPLSLAALTVAVTEGYQLRAEAKKIRLSFEAADTELLIFADLNAVQNVLSNLISNAVKYCPPHSEVAVQVHAAEGRVRCRIADNGPGITADDQKKLFQKFAKLSNQPTGGENATGLGLSIVKRLVDATSGTVRCESEVGKGTAFITEWPVHAAAPDGGPQSMNERAA